MVLFLYGADTYQSREYLRESIEQFKKQRDPQGFNVRRLDGKTVETGALIAELLTMPFLAEKRLVVVENLLSNNDRELLGWVIGKVAEKKMPESTVAVFWQGEPLSKVKEAKELEALLKKEKYAREFGALTGGEVADFILKEAKKRGAEFSAEAVSYLSEHTGGDTWFLASLIAQLSAYKISSLINLSDAELFLDEKMDDNVFALTDAIAAGNHKQAFKLLREQKENGEEESKLFGLVVWQFRQLLSLADALEREPNLTSDGAAKKLGLHPFVAKKNFALAKKYSLGKLAGLYRELLNADIKTKTGAAPQSVLLDLFVAKV